MPMLDEDFEAVLHADALGFDDVWIGEHFSSMTEPITSPLMFLAKAIPLTKRVRLCTGVLNLPQQHPAVIAGFAAMFDHLSNGRFVMGIGPGGLPSDFELFGLEDAMARGKMTLELIETILKIWSTEPPYRIEGEFWQIRQDEWHWPELGLGHMPKPYQQPHPPIAIAGMSPYPFFVKEAAPARLAWRSAPTSSRPQASRPTGSASARAAPRPASSLTAIAGMSRARSWSPTPMPRPKPISPGPTAPCATIFTT